MNTKELIGQRVMIYQENGEREGAAIIQTVEIEPSVLEILDDGQKVYTAYCTVEFENDIDGEQYFRWVRTDNLMVQP